MPQNLIEKIAQRYAVGLESGQIVRSGDYLSVKPAHVMTHDNTGAVIPKFKKINVSKIANPGQVVFTLDHNVQDKSEKNLKKYRDIENFAQRMGVDFYPAGRGIGHQIMCEEGYAWPGTMVVASDSHSNMYGGLGCLGTPIVRTDAAAIWATGRTWWQIPPVAKVILKGALNKGVTGKDVIIALCGFFNNDEVLNHAVEFVGEGVEVLTIDQRLSIANMTTEWGALAGVFPIDEMTIQWLKDRMKFIERRGLAGVPSDKAGEGRHPRLNAGRIQELVDTIHLLRADPEALYTKELTLALDSVHPHVSGPNSVKVMSSLAEIRKKKVKIDKAYLVSCVNSRLEDIAEAAKAVDGKKVSKGVEFYISAASSEIQQESEKLGYWQTLIDAGAMPLPPGCGPCIGLGKGLLQDGEVGISATNRNFKGRMGSREAFAYLASPAVVAASAISGFIDYPGNWHLKTVRGKLEDVKRPSAKSSKVSILKDFPKTIDGTVVFCHQNNLNTDGIFPGKYTYIDDFTPEQQASVVMENYDPDFRNIVMEGDILLGGFNFGTGSSREQAATALKYKGIKLVVAGSFSETYKRNALNNGFLVIEAPEMVKDFSEKYGVKRLTVRTADKIKINFQASIIEANNKQYTFSPVGIAAQELIVSGGLESWVKLQR